MFSKSKLNEPIDPGRGAEQPQRAEREPLKPTLPNASAVAAAQSAAAQQQAAARTPAQQSANTGGAIAAQQRSPKPAPSIISADLTIKGNLETTGDMQIEGTIDGDIRSHLLTIGQNAVVRGEIVADDVVVNGRVIGRIRGAKIRLSSTARVEGDILHKNIAIESGAQFEGSVQRSEDPIGQDGPMRKVGSSSYPGEAGATNGASVAAGARD